MSHGVDIVYTFGRAPSWASTNPTGSCDGQPDGACYAPHIADWQTFVTAITSRYKGKITYWELWNEPNAENFWKGTTTQMAEMAQTAYPIIKNADPGNMVLSPSPQGQYAYKWLDEYFSAGAVAYTDIVAFHGYIYNSDPEAIITLSNNVKNAQAKYSGLNGKPVWDREHSWGAETAL